MDIKIGTHSFTFNESTNSGEGLTLHTEILFGDDVYLNQELTLQSYGNHATFGLYGATLTPEILRKLADELEESINYAKKAFVK